MGKSFNEENIVLFGSAPAIASVSPFGPGAIKEKCL
jgi:hypothetical protein